MVPAGKVSSLDEKQQVFLKEVSVCLVDCMKMPAALRRPIKQEQLEGDSLLHMEHLTQEEALLSQQEASDASAPKEEREEEQILSTGGCADDGHWSGPPVCSLTQIKIHSIRTLHPGDQGSGVPEETENSADGSGRLSASQRDGEGIGRRKASAGGSLCNTSTLSTMAAASENRMRSDHMDTAETRRDGSEGRRGEGMEDAPQEMSPAPEAGQDHEGVKPQLTLTSTFSCPECSYSVTAQIFLHEHIKRSHVELYSQLLKSGEIRAEILLPSVASQPIRASGTGQKTSNPNRTRSHCCHQCGKSFSLSSDLKKHQRVHTGERPYHCDQCGKCFGQLGHLNRHQRVHTGEKLYRCDQCGNSFNQLGMLKSHLRVHTGEKPYHCDQCGKSFSRLDSLKSHLRVHTGERPYHCDQCGKSFSRLYSLKSHQRVHLGETPYHCDQCGKSFSRFDRLKSHQRVHTGETPYHCDQCGKSFTRLDGLRSHQRVHRRDAVPL